MPIASNSLPGTLALFGLPGHWEVIIIVLAVLLLFGGRKIPEMARGLARGLRIFKDEMKGIKTDVEDSVSGNDEDKAKSSDQASGNNQGGEDKS
ncbi:MAG: twin-arginine translocase TatA/TatE family subunit [Planctomycetota bacterium]|jgi:sec-independent protein translocase protein TatA